MTGTRETRASAKEVKAPLGGEEEVDVVPVRQRTPDCPISDSRNSHPHETNLFTTIYIYGLPIAVLISVKRTSLVNVESKTMVKNDIKIAWRTYARNKTYTFITIFGLTVGLLACMLVATVVMDDLSYDRFWSKSDNIYRIIRTAHRSTGDETIDRTFANFGTELSHNFPEVERAMAVSAYDTQVRLDKTGDSNIDIHILQADTNVWAFLDIAVTAGTPQQYVAGQKNIVISEVLKMKLFPHEDPVGKFIYQHANYGGEATPLVITGVMKDLPTNSYLRADAMIVEAPLNMELNRGNWGFFQEQLVLIKPETDLPALTAKVNKWYADFLTELSEQDKKDLPKHAFQSLKDIYLHSDFSTSQSVKGNSKNIYIFSIIAGLILLIACINFINLNMAKAIKQIRESGIRKVLGASRKQLIRQFLAEATLMFFISAIFASVAYIIVLPALENFLGHPLTFKLWNNVLAASVYFLLVLTLIVLSATYPAWAFSGVQVANSLKNKISSPYFASGSSLRRGLIAFQFGIALLVLTGMITVWRQLAYINQTSLGYDTHQLYAISYFGKGNKATTLQQQINALSGVEQSTLSAWTPTKGNGGLSKRIDDPDKPNEKREVHFISAIPGLAETIGFDLLKGRLLTARDTLTTGSSQILNTEEDKKPITAYSKVLLNETAARILKVTALDSPLHLLEITPVGIIHDFHSVSFHDPIKPTVITAEQNLRYSSLLFRTKSGTEAQVFSSIQRLWKTFYNAPMPEIQAVGDLVQKQYEKEQAQQQLLTLFSGLALLLASLGVFGVIAHATAQRTKEVGIRKVLGAPIYSILLLFSKDYIKLIGIALLICSPIAWYFSNKWLEDFAYRTEVQWWFFATAGITVLLVTLITVNVQTIKTARANPVDSLRDE